MPRVFGTYQGVAAWVLDGRGTYRVNRNFEVMGGVRYEKLSNMERKGEDTVITVIGGLAL